MTSGILFALAIGAVASCLGLAVLLPLGLLPAGIAALCWILYIMVYTPLKAMTSLNTVVGAIPGALPPLIGWTATGAPLSMLAFVPFLLASHAARSGELLLLLDGGSPILGV